MLCWGGTTATCGAQAEPDPHRSMHHSGSPGHPAYMCALRTLAATVTHGAECVQHRGPAPPAVHRPGRAGPHDAPVAPASGREHPLPGTATAVLPGPGPVRRAPLPVRRAPGVRGVACVQAHSDRGVPCLSAGTGSVRGGRTVDRASAQLPPCAVHGEDDGGTAAGEGPHHGQIECAIAHCGWLPGSTHVRTQPTDRSAATADVLRARAVQPGLPRPTVYLGGATRWDREG